MKTLKKLKDKKQFVNVIPKSSKAKERFVNVMSSFHAMEIKEETEDEFFLVSINRKYYTWIPKKGNEHWQVLK